MYLTDATVTKGKPGDFGRCQRHTSTTVCGEPASRWLEGGTYGDGSDEWELALCSPCHRELVQAEEAALKRLDELLSEMP